MVSIKLVIAVSLSWPVCEKNKLKTKAEEYKHNKQPTENPQHKIYAFIVSFVVIFWGYEWVGEWV